MHILIAEDRPTLQLALSYLLTAHGHHVAVAAAGPEAAPLALPRCFDLSLMDLQMPLIDGLAATREIRAHSARHIPILALTANSWDRHRALAAGMDDFLVKPWDNDELLAKIQSLTVKAAKIERCGTYLRFGKEQPMNAEHLQELRKLDEKGCTKLIVMAGGGELVVHKNMQNKIAHDFVVKGQEIAEFLDRSEEKPGLCHLYRHSLNVKCLLPEELERMEREEDERMGAFGRAVFKRE